MDETYVLITPHRKSAASLLATEMQFLNYSFIKSKQIFNFKINSIFVILFIGKT